MGLFSSSSASTSAFNEQAASQGGSGSGGSNASGAGSFTAQEAGAQVAEANLSNSEINIQTSDPVVAVTAINDSSQGELAALQIAQTSETAALSHNHVESDAVNDAPGAVTPTAALVLPTNASGGSSFSWTTIGIGAVVLFLGVLFLVHRK